MATVRQYGHYLKGNKLALVEKDTSFDNDPDNKDYGPGTDKIRWKSPLTDITNGLEIEYAYSPKYFINDTSDTGTGASYESNAGSLQFNGFGGAVGNYIVIRGSSKWNGLHKIIASSDATNVTVDTNYGGPPVTDTFTAYKDVNRLSDEADKIPLPEYLAKVLVYYVKAKFMEDMGRFEESQYFMKEFYRLMERYESGRVWGARMVSPGPLGVR